MVPQRGEKKGKAGRGRGTMGAAPGPRRGRRAECPRATRGAFYIRARGGGKRAEKRLIGGAQGPIILW